MNPTASAIKVKTGGMKPFLTAQSLKKKIMPNYKLSALHILDFLITYTESVFDDRGRNHDLSRDVFIAVDGILFSFKQVGNMMVQGFDLPKSRLLEWIQLLFQRSHTLR